MLEPKDKKEIIYVDPMHTAKVLVLVYLCFSIPIVCLALFVAFVRGVGSIDAWTVLSTLVFNAIFGFSLLWIGCRVYNWVASKFGGIEFVTRVHEDKQN